MSALVVTMAAGSILAWGMWGVLAKMAQNQVGMQVLVWDSAARVPILLLFLAASDSLLPLKMDLRGILLSAGVGAAACMGTVLFYLVLRQIAANVAVPLLALYPAVSVLLAIPFLGEKLTPTHAAGVALALAAGFLLTR